MEAQTFVIKVRCGDELRRFTTDASVSYDEVMARIAAICPASERGVVRFLDDEGDYCTLGCQEDLEEALNLVAGAANPGAKPLLRLDVSVRKAPPAEVSAGEQSALHSRLHQLEQQAQAAQVHMDEMAASILQLQAELADCKYQEAHDCIVQQTEQDEPVEPVAQDASPVEAPLVQEAPCEDAAAPEEMPTPAEPGMDEVNEIRGMLAKRGLNCFGRKDELLARLQEGATELERGQAVLYKGQQSAEVVSVHREDDEAYYTIRFEDGRERQTTKANLAVTEPAEAPAAPDTVSCCETSQTHDEDPSPPTTAQSPGAYESLADRGIDLSTSLLADDADAPNEEPATEDAAMEGMLVEEDLQQLSSLGDHLGQLLNTVLGGVLPACTTEADDDEETAVPEAAVDEEAAAAEVQPSEEAAAQDGPMTMLVDMGFAPEHARVALAAAGGDLDQAIEIALSQPAAEEFQPISEEPEHVAEEPEQEATPEQADEWEELMAELVDMGFRDPATNRQVLADKSGDLKETVRELVKRERLSRQSSRSSTVSSDAE